VGKLNVCVLRRGWLCLCVWGGGGGRVYFFFVKLADSSELIKLNIG
jgi:hypothetical protein